MDERKRNEFDYESEGETMYPLKLKPIYDKTIWANNKLTTLRDVKEEGCGTCWEVSAHPYAQNKVLNGEYKVMDLLTLIQENEKAMLGTHTLEKMLRLAYLDAKEDLSIQVHPYNSYAMAHDNDLGKTESWYVLEAEEGATLVAGTLCDDKDVLRKAIEEENLEQYLRKVPMQAGDFIFVPAGMLHALGGGIFAIEVGTNSNTTYRFYDYGRKDANGNGRELHLEKSFDVVDLSLQSEKVSTPLEDGKEQAKMLVSCDDFCVMLYDIDGEKTFDTKGIDFHTLSFVHNDAVIEYCGESIPVHYTDNVFVPAACEKYTIKGKCRVLISTAR